LINALHTVRHRTVRLDLAHPPTESSDPASQVARAASAVATSTYPVAPIQHLSSATFSRAAQVPWPALSPCRGYSGRGRRRLPWCPVRT
jgi:hypothetical protein